MRNKKAFSTKSLSGLGGEFWLSQGQRRILADAFKGVFRKLRCVKFTNSLKIK